MAQAPVHGTPQLDELIEVSRALSNVVRERWGRGPGHCRSHWAGPDALVTIMEDSQTPAEKSLSAAGHPQSVIAGRRLLWKIVEADARSIVERATGRAVTAILTSTRSDPDLSAAIFILSREPPGERPGDSSRTPLDTVSESYALAAQSRQARSQSRRARADSQAFRDSHRDR